MTAKYEFSVDDDARSFCDRIVAEMMKIFSISEEEAVGRINRQWREVDFVPDDLRYHESEEFWANDIYYGHGSFWWTNPPGLRPTPYP